MKDFHVHERHSGDADEATAAGYVEIAEKKGIDEICFTAHLIITGPYTQYSIDPDLISEYFKEIEEVQASTKIALRIGLEVDYFPQEKHRLASIMNEYDFDFLLGSLHFPDGFNIASKEGFTAYSEGKKIKDVLDGYYSLWKDAVESGLFDIMAHPDYFRRSFAKGGIVVPKFEEYGNVVFDAIHSLKEHGVGFEVNSSGFRHGIEDCYPTLGFLEATKEAGIGTVTIGSDSHMLNQLGMGLDSALKELQAAGYHNVSVFSDRKSHTIDITELRKS